MSFSSLPIELVRQIIDSTSSTFYLPDTYKIRQNTLRSLCLVSRRFSLFARPLLYELVQIGPPRQLVSILNTVQASAGLTSPTNVVFRDTEDLEIDWDFDRLAFLSGQTIRSLTLEIGVMECLDLCFLELFPGLSRHRLALCVNVYSLRHEQNSFRFVSLMTLRTKAISDSLRRSYCRN